MSLSFLRELYSSYPQDGSQLCEIRTIDTDAVVVSRYFGLHKLDRAAEYAKSQATTTNVYMGVLPRFVKESGGGAGRDYHVNSAAWLWCDIDRGDATQSEFVDFLRHKHARLPHPRMIVLSGSGGAHLYWRLAAVRALTTNAERNEFKNLMQRLVLAVGHGASNLHADPACVNASRILRLPHTYNHKHDPPSPVQGVLCEHATDLTIQEWSGLLPFLPMTIQKPRIECAPVSGEMRKFTTAPPGLVRWAARGYPEGNRHNDLVGAAAYLRRNTDLPDPIAYDLLVTKATNSRGRRSITQEEIDKAWKWAGSGS